MRREEYERTDHGHIAPGWMRLLDFYSLTNIDIDDPVTRGLPAVMRIYSLVRPKSRAEKAEQMGLAPSDLVGRDAELADLEVAEITCVLRAYRARLLDLRGPRPGLPGEEGEPLGGIAAAVLLLLLARCLSSIGVVCSRAILVSADPLEDPLSHRVALGVVEVAVPQLEVTKTPDSLAIDSGGTVSTGSLDAPDRMVAVKMLEQRGLDVLLEDKLADVVPGHGQRLASRDEIGQEADLVIVVGGDGMDNFMVLAKLFGQFRTDNGMGPLHLVVNRFTDVMQQAHTPGQLLLEAQLGRHDTA